MTALQQFFNTERIGRGWTMKDAANRSQISLSKAYAISNGDDNVESETFENIAAAFNMSPAELAVAIGKGAAADDPKRVSIHAALREVPDEQLATVDLMIRGLAIQPTPRSASNRRSDGASNTRRGERRILDRRQRPNEETDSQGGLETVHPGHIRAVAAFSFTNILSNLKQWLEPYNQWPAAQPIQ